MVISPCINRGCGLNGFSIAGDLFGGFDEWILGIGVVDVFDRHLWRDYAPGGVLAIQIGDRCQDPHLDKDPDLFTVHAGVSDIQDP